MNPQSHRYWTLSLRRGQGEVFQDELGLDWLDYGARMYDAVLGRWHVQDRFSEKYYSLSNYSYGANNPVLMIDINGDSIWVNYVDQNGANQKLLYTSGMKYTGNDKFVSAVVSCLNDLGSTDIGNTVVTTLSGSKNNYSYSNTPATDSKGNIVQNALSFAASANGGGVIHAAALLNTSTIQQGQIIENASHELFHGYQSELGETGFTANREVGAYLFGRAVALSLGYGALGFGNSTPAGTNYETSMTNLLFSNSFNQNDYNTAVSNFVQGSSANINGVYNRAIVKANDTSPVIKSFFPLVR